MGLPDETTGVAVMDVAPASPAEQVGFQPKDIVREINGQAVTSTDALNKMANSGSRRWRFTIEREGRLMTQMLRF